MTRPPSTSARRLDQVLVERGLARSRGQAQDLIRAAAVDVDGAPASKPAQPVTPGQSVRVTAPHSGAVGRGYPKLAHALRTWPQVAQAVTGARCLDAGASTGGFTQVLLAAGAASVVALDVGRGQLAPSLRDDPRVVDRSGINLRDVGPDDLGGTFDMIVADLSFISLTLVLPVLRQLAHPHAHAVVLVKPQFEVGRGTVGRSGVVRDAAQRAEAVTRVAESAMTAGWAVRDVQPSPLPGSTGNTEYLLWIGPGAVGALESDAVRSAVWAVVTGTVPPCPTP